MAIRITVTQLGRRIGEAIDRALTGEVIQVTKYGRVVAEMQSAIPEGGDGITVSVTEFSATPGTLIDQVENEGKTLVITRRERPVVAITQFQSLIGGVIENERGT